jgi:hypothetical protein
MSTIADQLAGIGESEPSKAWLGRMLHAAQSSDVGPEEFERLSRLFYDYLRNLEDEEEAGVIAELYSFAMHNLGLRRQT